MGREKPLPYFSVNWDRIKNILKYASHEQIAGEFINAMNYHETGEIPENTNVSDTQLMLRDCFIDGINESYARHAQKVKAGKKGGETSKRRKSHKKKPERNAPNPSNFNHYR